MRRPAGTSPSERGWPNLSSGERVRGCILDSATETRGAMKAVQTLLRRRGLMCLLIGAAALASWWPRWGGPIDLRWVRRRLLHPRHFARPRRGLPYPQRAGRPVEPVSTELLLRTTDPVVVGHALRVTVALCSAAYAIVVFLLLSASLPRALAAAVTLVGVLQPQYVYFTGTPTQKAFSASSRSSSSS